MPMEVSWTRRARRLPIEVREKISLRLNTLQPYFPELSPQVRVGLTRLFEGFVFQSSRGFVRLNLEVRKRKGGLWQYPTYYTIAHELMHLVQFNSDEIPSGETACDIFTLERLPPRFIDESPTYLFVPPRAREAWREVDAELAHTLAKTAVKRLENGDASYASYWEDEFEHQYITTDHSGCRLVDHRVQSSSE
ncbi:MAG: hypothetical protein JSU93_06245 [Methanobacteriota archaeon]|nr:MAG: hypothetical protein JSU93_06245 [Euryarchaeota archaeon]